MVESVCKTFEKIFSCIRKYWLVKRSIWGIRWLAWTITYDHIINISVKWPTMNSCDLALIFEFCWMIYRNADQFTLAMVSTRIFSLNTFALSREIRDRDRERKERSVNRSRSHWSRFFCTDYMKSREVISVRFHWSI